jgi:hypothetical protein
VAVLIFGCNKYYPPMNEFQKREKVKEKKLEVDHEKFKNIVEKYLKISKENKEKINFNFENQKKPKIIFDTDIGSDIDDSLALLLLLHLPEEEYELLGNLIFILIQRNHHSLWLCWNSFWSDKKNY